MDYINPANPDETELAETPEDVAVLYSWANLQGAKYRDFSASRREYRAQMRQRQAEQMRQEEMRGKSEAEAAAAEAERAARQAEEAARFHEEEARRASQQRRVGEYQIEQEAKERAEAHAAELNRIAAAERVEVARRAEAVAAAESAARREAREVAEAHASAARQAARYEESENRRSTLAGPQPTAIVPGEISDPYMNDPAILPGRLFHQPHSSQDDMSPSRLAPSREGRLLIPQPDPLDRDHREVREYWVTGSIQHEAAIAAGGASAIEKASHDPREHLDLYGRDLHGRNVPVHPDDHPSFGLDDLHNRNQSPYVSPYIAPRAAPEPTRAQEPPRAGVFASRPQDASVFGLNSARKSRTGIAPAVEALKPTRIAEGAPTHDPIPGSPRPESAVVRAAHRSGSVPVARPEPPRERKPRGYRPDEASGFHSSQEASIIPDSENAVPAWISSERIPVAQNPARTQEVERSYDRRARAAGPAESVPIREVQRPRTNYAPLEPLQPGPLPPVPPQFAYPPLRRPDPVPAPNPVRDYRRPEEARISQPATDWRGIAPEAPSASAPVGSGTLQHSREQVAARWFALKGAFDKSEHAANRAEATPDRQVRVPMVGIFSFAGGVGKTSLVATLGRALSSTGEKVLLADTTSHGLLPFYFGASELRPGVVRRFSPPANSRDAAIALIGFDVPPGHGDEHQYRALAAEFKQNSLGMQRMLVDLSPVSQWVVRPMATEGAMILVPVTPDMNSVISLGAVEKFFAGLLDSAGRPVQPYYILNQFDASLPLHLDVREVMRQQLGDRILPFVIRRSPVISEALAEGMTVIDYAPDSAAAGDYINLAQWLHGQSAPAGDGVKTARWSER